MGKPTVTVYQEQNKWYWIQVDEQGDTWYNKAHGPFTTNGQAWDDANKYFGELRN